MLERANLAMVAVRGAAGTATRRLTGRDRDARPVRGTDLPDSHCVPAGGAETPLSMRELGFHEMDALALGSVDIKIEDRRLTTSHDVRALLDRIAATVDLMLKPARGSSGKCRSERLTPPMRQASTFGAMRRRSQLARLRFGSERQPPG